MKYARHTQFLKSFGKNLRKIRLERKLTQEELANRADIEISQVSRIERGIINTSISQVYQIAKAMEIHPKELFDFEYITPFE